MSFATSVRRDAQMSDINITPLVDVMLVLLVIFMIALPAISNRLRADLPQPGHEAVPHVAKLAIQAGDVYTLDGVALGRVELARELSAMAVTGTSLEVNADPDADYDSVAQGLAIARNAGVESVVMADR